MHPLAVASSTSNNCSLKIRHRRHQRLQKNLSALLGLCAKIQVGDTDPYIEHLMKAYGFRQFELALAGVKVGGRTATLVCAPYLVWTQHAKRLLAFKHDAQLADRKVVLVPESVVQRQPRLNNALMVANASEVHVPPTGRMQILAHLIDNGSRSTIRECSTVLDHPDPVAAVFALIASGVLSIDLTRLIVPDSIVELAAPPV